MPLTEHRHSPATAQRRRIYDFYALKELVAQSCPALCDPADCSPPGSPAHGDFPSKNTGVGCHDLPNPGIEPGSLTSQADSLPSEPPGKPIIYDLG